MNGHSESGIKITKFQWRIDNRWIDLCDATDEGTCTATIRNEMNEEDIYFRSIDVDGNISQITQNPITIRIDTTIPTCDLITTGTMGDNSWYVDDVTISFNSSKTKDLSGNDPDAISGIAKRIVTLGDVSGSPTAVQTSDTTSITWYGYVEDRAQNYQTCNITFKKDETKPECSFLLNGEKGNNDWYIGNVLVSFANKIDNTSQVASYGIGSLLGSKETTHTLDTANQTYIGYIKYINVRRDDYEKAI